MTAELSLRRYRPADRERVRRLHEEALRGVDAYAEEVPGDGDGDADLQAISERYFDDGGEFLVGEVDGEVVAMGALKRVDEETAEVTRMRVDPDHQRRGYGKRVLRELESRAAEIGYATLVLDTTERQTGAKRLYETFGYERTGAETYGEWHVVFYRKSIADA